MLRAGIVCNIVSILVTGLVISCYTFYYAPHALTSKSPRTSVDLAPDGRADNLFWIVQVSDIHISRYWDPQRALDFKEFCTDSLAAIDPDVVLITGDLTDAKSRNKFDSQQYQDEWETYRRVIKESGVTKRFVWLDIRGNHDAFDVMDAHDPNSNLYLKYSGDKGKLSSKVYHLQKPYGTYSFIPVDATMVPGPRRPYNFAGYLSEPKMKTLESFQSEVSRSNFTIWYSHYPTSSITSRSPGIRSLISETGSLYVAGHLHTLGGLSRSLYALHTGGFVELELADWQWDRTYRIIAIDHDLFSFTDVKYNQWPAVVLTNPKPARLMMSKFEPLQRMAKSTHIRFLIFDPWEIDEVHVTIDGVTISEKPQQVNRTNLWVSKWNPTGYNTGMHDIEIYVRDSKGNTKILHQQFSLDESWTADFGWLSPLVILSDFSSLVNFTVISVTVKLLSIYVLQLFCAFHFVVFSYIAVMILFRTYHLNFGIPMGGKVKSLLRNKFVYYGLLGFPLNLAIGPWFIGEINRGTISVCFSYGLLVDGTFQPDDVTLYRDAIEIMVLLYMPSLFFLAELNHQGDNGKNILQRSPKWPLPSFLLAYVFFLFINFYSVWGLYQSYGYIAAILSPFKLWWIFFLLSATLRIYHKNA